MKAATLVAVALAALIGASTGAAQTKVTGRNLMNWTKPSDAELKRTLTP